MTEPPSTPPPNVVDCHAHILPSFASASGFSSAEEHLLYIQRAMHTHGSQPVRRARDHAITRTPTLWDPEDPSPAGRYDVAFHVGRNGRFEWSKDGENYYIQFMPPTLQTMEAPVDFMINQMDYAGIQTAVLQNDHIYGSLNHYFSDALKQYPDRFIGLAQVEEPLAFQDDQIESLQLSIKELGLRGLYFTTSTFFSVGYAYYYDDTRFTSFWDEVERLRLPVFWVFPTSSPIGDYREEMRRFQAWSEAHPSVDSVLVHGIPDPPFLGSDGRLALPDWMLTLVRDFPVHAEILYPLRWGGVWDYPYPQAHDRIRYYYDTFGPEKLMWGSDMPNVERYCTYRQTLTYFSDYCDFIPPSDKQKMLADNTLKLFRHTSASFTSRSNSGGP